MKIDYSRHFMPQHNVSDTIIERQTHNFEVQGRGDLFHALHGPWHTAKSCLISLNG